LRSTLFEIKSPFLNSYFASRRKRQEKKETKSPPAFSAPTPSSKTSLNNNVEKEMLMKLELNLKTEDSMDEAGSIYFYKRLKPEQEELINRLVSLLFFLRCMIVRLLQRFKFQYLVVGLLPRGV
jgi:hypothetical protein